MTELDFASLEEFTPHRGKRVDVMGLGPRGEFWIIECKSGLADYRADSKWQSYLDWADRFFWAVDANFPHHVLPSQTGLMIADDYGAEIVRMAPEERLPPARRRALTQKFARDAARRLLVLKDAPLP